MTSVSMLTPDQRWLDGTTNILDGEVWRDVLGPELSEHLIAQAWDDAAHGRHKEEMYQQWEVIRWHNAEVQQALRRQLGGR